MNGLLSFSLPGIETCFTITRPSSVNSLNVSMEVRAGMRVRTTVRLTQQTLAKRTD